MIRKSATGKPALTLTLILLLVSTAAQAQRYNVRLVHDDKLFCIFDSLRLPPN